MEASELRRTVASLKSLDTSTTSFTASGNGARVFKTLSSSSFPRNTEFEFRLIAKFWLVASMILTPTNVSGIEKLFFCLAISKDAETSPVKTTEALRSPHKLAA